MFPKFCTRVFEEMEAKLREIKQILESASISNDELVGVQVSKL
jgi:hypothetical protein